MHLHCGGMHQYAQLGSCLGLHCMYVRMSLLKVCTWVAAEASTASLLSSLTRRVYMMALRQTVCSAAAVKLCSRNLLASLLLQSFRQ